MQLILIIQFNFIDPYSWCSLAQWNSLPTSPLKPTTQINHWIHPAPIIFILKKTHVLFSTLNLTTWIRFREIFLEKNQVTFPWILDTRVTDHVTYEKIVFVTFYKIKPISVKLPNNSLVTAKFAGTVQFSEKFIIFNTFHNSLLTLYLFKNWLKILTSHYFFSWDLLDSG